MKVLAIFYSVLIQNVLSQRVCNSVKYSEIEKICRENEAPKQSEMTCFKDSIEFTIGTNEPLFKYDGEAPARLIHLQPYCID